MKMKKVLCLSLAVVTVLAMSVPAMAADVGTTTYNGSKLSSTFDDQTFSDHAYNLLPGDSTELTVSVKNDSTKTTDWYLENQVVSSLEDSVKASGGAYSYTLTYYDSENQATVIYDSEVGGDSTAAGTGLNQVNTSSDTYFYLDRLTTSDTGKVTLKISLDGETQGNAYQDSIAKLQMRFAVEDVANNETVVHQPGQTTTLTNAIQGPKTGDYSRLFLYSVMALAAGCVLFILFVVDKKRRNQEEKGAM